MHPPLNVACVSMFHLTEGHAVYVLACDAFASRLQKNKRKHTFRIRDETEAQGLGRFKYKECV